MRQEQLQLTGGGKKENRRALDFYPTPKDVTIALMDFLDIPCSYNVWEPAYGNGAMATIIDRYVTRPVFCTDIIYGDDFLNTNCPENINAIITNPPFNLSAQFIEKAVKEADVVAMLLKSQYWHAASRTSLFEKYPPTWVLPLNWRPDFLEYERKEGDKKGAPTMEVAWSVWIKGDTDTKYRILKKP